MKKLLCFTVNSTIAVLKMKLERNIHLGLSLWKLLYSYHLSSVTHGFGGARGGGGGAPLYKPYSVYVPPQRVWFWRRFGLKTGIDFAHVGLESGMVYQRNFGSV